MGNAQVVRNIFYLNNELKYTYIDIPYCITYNREKSKCDDYAGFYTYFYSSNGNYEAAKQRHLLKCERYNDDGTCSKCNSGYEIDKATNKCVLKGCKKLKTPSTKCEFCEHEYILVDNNTRCMPISEAYEKTEILMPEPDDNEGQTSKGNYLNTFFKLNMLLFSFLLFK